MRVSYFNNGNGAEVLEENNYYPFGLKHEGYNTLAGNPAYKYQYNGKELQQETGWNDYGARMYMPELGRWGVMDPLAEALRRHTPYNYGVNNPISFIDPDGRLSQSFMDGLSGLGSGTYTNTGSGFSDGMGSGMDYNGKRFVGGASTPNTALGPRPSWWERTASWLTDRFRGRGAGITTTLPGATVSRVGTVEVGPVEPATPYDPFTDPAFARRFDDPVKMIGGTGDVTGLLDIGAQIISNWEPENQYLAIYK